MSARPSHRCFQSRRVKLTFSYPPSLSCFIQNNVTFYVSVVAYAVLIFLFNVAVNNATVEREGARARNRLPPPAPSRFSWWSSSKSAT